MWWPSCCPVTVVEVRKGIFLLNILNYSSAKLYRTRHIVLSVCVQDDQQSYTSARVRQICHNSVGQIILFFQYLRKALWVGCQWFLKEYSSLSLHWLYCAQILWNLLSFHCFIENQSCINKTINKDDKTIKGNMFLTIRNSELMFPPRDYWRSGSPGLLDRIVGQFRHEVLKKRTALILRFMRQFTDS